MKIGAHVSTAGGPVTLYDRAEAIGAEAVQIFLTPPQQWRSSKVEETIAQAFHERGARTDEIITLLRRLWTDDVVEHHEGHYDLGPLAFDQTG